MKKILPFVCLLPLIAFSQEISINGGHGMFKLQYARPHNMGMLSFNIGPEWRYDPVTVAVQGLDVTDRRHYLNLTAGVSYAIIDYMETWFHATGFGKYYEATDFPVSRGDPSPVAGMKTYEIGLKIGYPFEVNPVTPLYYAIGVDGYVDIGPGLSNTGLVPEVYSNDSALAVNPFNFPPHIPHSPDIGFSGLFDLRVGFFATHLNVGYLMTGEDRNPGYVTNADFQQMIRPNYLTHGLGIELIPAQAMILLFEVDGFYNTSASAESLWVTPGVRFGSRGVSFDLGCEFGLQGTSYWKPFFNFSFGADLIRKVEVHIPLAKVTGKIYDEKTGEAVAAAITFPGSDQPAVQTLVDGTYEVSLPPGSYRAHVDAPDFRWKEQGILLKDGDAIVLDFHLNKIEIVQGTITGKIADAEDGKPISARITLTDSKIYATQTDSTTGIFKAIIPPGTYSIKVEAEYYLLESAPLILAKDEIKIQNFTLKKVPKVGEKIILKGIYFDFNSLTIKPESYPVLDDAAKVVKAKPKMRIEIGGHTDSVGSDSYNQKLSYQRAQAVKDYLVRYHNIDPLRIEVKGYGESQPIADNRTKAGRDFNRRIEFKILSVD